MLSAVNITFIIAADLATLGVEQYEGSVGCLIQNEGLDVTRN